MLVKKNVELYEEYSESITVNGVRDAFHILIGAASTLPKFNCYPKRKGAIQDFRYYTPGYYSIKEQHPFAFIINKQSLLFYLRPHAVESNKYKFEDLIDSFDEVNQNKKGEWTIRINNPDDAIKINEQILLVW